MSHKNRKNRATDAETQFFVQKSDFFILAMILLF